MTRHRARLDRLAAEQAARDEECRPFVAPEVRALADELGVFLGSDDELRRLPQPTPEDVAEMAAALGVDLDDRVGLPECFTA